MPNYYHLIARSLRANTSVALRWMNNGHAIWWNQRHRRTGHVFQVRFKGVVVEAGLRLLELSLYAHFNAVALRGLGWGKPAKQAERQGLSTPSPKPGGQPCGDVARLRLEQLPSLRGLY